MNPGSTQPLPAAWKAYPQARILTDELKALLISHFATARLWGFKQPLSSIVWPIYEQALLELNLKPEFVICVRNPLEVMASEASETHAPGTRHLARYGTQAVGVWLNYTLSALNAAKESACTVIPYKHLVINPKQSLAQVVDQHAEWNPTEAMWNAATENIKLALKHHDFDQSTLEKAPSLSRRLLELCESSPLDHELLESLIHEWQMWQAMLAPQGPSGTRIGLAWKARGQVDSVQIPFLPTGDWQLVRFELDAPPSTLLNGLVYNKPSRTWIRRAEFLTPSERIKAKLIPGPGSQLLEINGNFRLDGAVETQQVNFVTPKQPGPYRLELELLLEASPQISQDTAARLADRLHQCAARTSQLLRQRGSNR
jgi:hypothetical protein